MFSVSDDKLPRVAFISLSRHARCFSGFRLWLFPTSPIDQFESEVDHIRRRGGASRSTGQVVGRSVADRGGAMERRDDFIKS